MITVTSLAARKLADYLAEQAISSPVRIAAINGCAGPALSLALDDCGANDIIEEKEGVTLLLDRDFAAICGQVTLEYLEKSTGCGCSGGGGFSLTSANPLPGAGTGCGGSCASGSCAC